MNSFELIKNEVVVPTCLSSSIGGNILAVGFTDDNLKLLDMRMKKGNDDNIFELEGGHTDMIK